MGENGIWPYQPSKILPPIAAAIVLVLASIISYRSYRKQWHHFNLIITTAGIMWLLGFILRTVSAFNTSDLKIYIAQYVLVFVGPPAYAASEFIILGRLMAYLPYHAPIHPGRVVSTFLFLGAVVEGMAAIGAGRSVKKDLTDSQRNTALLLIKVSLILQEIVELLFISMVAVVEYRCRRSKRCPKNVRIICRILYITSIMMMVRCIIRTIEGFQASACDPSAPDYDGHCGAIQENEWYLWVFEVVNILLFVAVLALFHPSKYIPSDKKQYLDPTDGITERIGPGYGASDSRSLLVTVLDPFDWFGMGSGKGEEKEKFWEHQYPIAEKSFASQASGKKESSMHMELLDPESQPKYHG